MKDKIYAFSDTDASQRVDTVIKMLEDNITVSNYLKVSRFCLRSSTRITKSEKNVWTWK